jgi:hypothetical protein
VSTKFEGFGWMSSAHKDKIGHSLKTECGRLAIITSWYAHNSFHGISVSRSAPSFTPTSSLERTLSACVMMPGAT